MISSTTQQHQYQPHGLHTNGGGGSFIGTAATAAAVVPGVGFFKLLTAFILGGLFFSTAIAAVSACYAVGLQNVKVLWDILQVIVQAVWQSFTAALSTAKAALTFKEDDAQRASWRWRSAWRVLVQELGKTRTTAAEGVAALRQEVALYAGAVGAPGLIPIQYLLDRFLPFSIAGTLEKSLKESLADIAKQTRSIQKIRLSSFSMGEKSPELKAARVYELGNQGVAYDVDVDWPSALEIKLVVSTVGGLARIPVVVKNVKFRGAVRLILTPLTSDPPGFGAALVSFPKAPEINLDVRVAGGDITRIPWLRSEVMSAIQKAVADELLWPRRVVVPSMVPTWTGTGLKEKPILSKDVLVSLEKRDPLLAREEELAESPMLRKQYEQPQLSNLKQQFKVYVNRKDSSDESSSTLAENLTKANTEKESIDHAKGSKQEEDDSSHTVPVESGILWQKLVQSSRQAFAR
jgi:hypothetical protein